MFRLSVILLILLTLDIQGLARICNIKDYHPKEGAKGDDDNSVYNTKVIQKCIDDCRMNGTVYIPRGDWMVRSLYFTGKNVSLYFEPQAALVFSDNLTGVHAMFDNQPLLYFNDLHGLTISGYGTIDGRGQKWWENKYNLKSSAPITLVLKNSHNILIKEITLQNSPHIFLQTEECSQITIDQIRILGPEDASNTAGMGLSSSSQIMITNSDIQAGDDCIALTGTTYGVFINNTIFRFCHGISIGSDASNIRDVLVENVTLIGTSNGLRIKPRYGNPATVYNITYHDVRMIGPQLAFDLSPDDGNLVNADHLPPVKIDHVTFLDINVNGCDDAGIFNCSTDINYSCSNLIFENIVVSNYRDGFICQGISPMSKNVTPKLDCQPA